MIMVSVVDKKLKTGWRGEIFDVQDNGRHRTVRRLCFVYGKTAAEMQKLRAFITRALEYREMLKPHKKPSAAP